MPNSITRKITSELGPLFKKAKPIEEEVLNVTPPKPQGPKQQKPLQSNVIMNEEPANSSKVAPAVGTGALMSAPLTLGGDEAVPDDEALPEQASKEELKAAQPIAQDIDKSLSSALKFLDSKNQAPKAAEWKPKSLNLSEGSKFDAEQAERTAANEASKRVSAATEPAMKEYTNTVKEIQNLYRTERDSLKKQEIWEGLIHAAGLIAAGVYGVRSGVDMSGVKFNPTNWQAKLAESREHMNSMLDQAEKEMGVAYKNMELTERTRDKLLDNAYRAWQAENATIEQSNKRKQAEWDAWKQAELLGVTKSQAETASAISKQQLKNLQAIQAEMAAGGMSPEKVKEMKQDQQSLLKAIQGIEKATKDANPEMRLVALKTYKVEYDRLAAKYGMNELALETKESGWLWDSIRSITPDEAISSGGELMKSMTPGVNKAPIQPSFDEKEKQDAIDFIKENKNDPRVNAIKEYYGI